MYTIKNIKNMIKNNHVNLTLLVIYNDKFSLILKRLIVNTLHY
jgi:hypothetical protein